MPGYVIHLAVAKEYIRNFRVKNEDEFLKGSLAPDLLSTDDKKETHYTETGSSEVDLKKFIKEKKINNSYMEGYFLHLIVDYLFYNQYFTNYDKRLYNEYDITNKELIEKYAITIPEEIKDCVQFKEGELEILEREKLYKMISEISKKRLSDYKREIKQTGIATTNTEDIKLVSPNENKKEKMLLGLIIAILCLVMLFFVNQKEGYHCDEIFSFGSSNSAYNNKYWAYKQYDGINKLVKEEIVENRNIIEMFKQFKYYFLDHPEEREKYEKAVLDELPEQSWRTAEEAQDYVKAQDNKFNYISVYYNQIQDVHPPLFYMLVHTVSSIFNDTFSKYIIFSINIIFFIGTCIFIWKILNLLRKKTEAFLAVILYGLSVGGISTVIFMRMYMMLTFFTTVYLYINIKIFKGGLKITKKSGFCLAITAILGFLTQYFFAIYAAIVSIVMIVLYIINKQYKDMRKYIGILVLSGVIGLLLFPFSIGHMLFSDRRITGFHEQNYFGKLMEYFKLILRYFGSNFNIVLSLFAIALLSIIIRRKKERGLMTIIILPTILYVMATARLAEFLELRYVMNILPIIAIMITMAISDIFENKIYNKMVAVAGVIILIGYGFLTEEPLCLYKGYNRYIEIAEQYKEDDFVYVGYSFFNHMQAMPEFMRYNKTLILYDTELERLEGDTELEDKNEFILSINTTMNPEKVLIEVLEKTGYTNQELIFEGVEGINQKVYRIYR